VNQLLFCSGYQQWVTLSTIFSFSFSIITRDCNHQALHFNSRPATPHHQQHKRLSFCSRQPTFQVVLARELKTIYIYIFFFSSSKTKSFTLLNFNCCSKIQIATCHLASLERTDYVATTFPSTPSPTPPPTKFAWLGIKMVNKSL
jgi:hypothetical protein